MENKQESAKERREGRERNREGWKILE